MSKLSYKTLFIIFFFLLISVVVLSRFVLPKNKVSAAWWNDSWHYRKAISVSNSSGSDLTDFQVSFSVGTSDLVASGKMQSDCDDIRVTDINGNLLPYWIEENNPGCNQVTDTKIWVKATSLPTSGSTIYLYYGNSSADSIQSGTNTFEFFDDFNDANKTNTNWTATGTGYTVTGGNLYHSTTLEPSNSFTTYTINNSSGFTNGIIESRMKPASCGNSYGKGIIARYSNDNNEYIAGLEAWTGNYTHVGRRVSGSWTNIDQDPLTCSTSTWYQFKWTLNGTSQLLSVNGVASSGVDSSFSSGKIGVHVDNKETPTGAYWDYLFVHKYASIDPTVTLQSEEAGGGPVAYWKFNEGTGTTIYDSSSNENNGYFGGVPPTWSSEGNCINEKCLDFSSATINISNKNTLNFGTNSFTISVWTKFRDYTYPKNTFEIMKNLCNQSVGSTGFSIGHTYNSNGANICISDGVNRVDSSITFNSGYKPTDTLNKWTYLNYVFDRTAGKVKVYVNGVKQSNELDISSVTGSINNTNNIIIGDVWGWKMDGLIDELKIYSYARTGAQIKLDYNSRGSSKGSSVNLGVKSNTAPSLNSKLIAHWRFDENKGSTASDSTNSKLVGNMLSSVSWAPKNQCISNGCIYINDVGTSTFTTVSVPDSSLFSNLSQMTVSTWIKTTSNKSQQQIIYKRQSNGTPSWNSFRLNLIDLKPSFIVTDTGGSGTAITSPTAIETNKWYHLTGVYTGSQIKLFINGQSAATPISKTGIILDSDSQLMIGGLDTSNTYYFNGYIDETKIYNSALTDQEVLQDYNQGSAINFGTTNQTIGGTTTSLEHCIPGDTSYCANPVAEWKMDERTGTSINDTSGNNNTGTFGAGNSAPTWTFGKIGAGLNFSTNQFITINDNSLLKPTAAITTEAWFNTTDKTLSQKIFSKTEGSGYNLAINEGGSACGSNYLCFAIYINGAYRVAGYPLSNLSNNTWYHVAGLYDGSTVKLFLNGINVGTTTSISNTITQGAYNMCIGSETNAGNCATAGNFFSGKIDQVKIYNYARTPAQIAYDYNKGGPVGWWKLDECQGNIAKDSSGIGNTGSIIIGASGSQNSLGTCTVGTSAAWTNGATGKINSSLNFDGTDDYIDITNNLGVYKELTISAWVKTNSTKSEGNTLMSNIYDFGSGWQGILLNIGRNTAGRVAYYAGGGWIESTSSNYNSDQWVNVVITHDSTGTVKFYKNSILDGTVTGKTLTNSTSPLFIGYERSGAPRYFQGQIDDVRVYNYALTSEQVKQVYNGGAINFQ